DGHGAVGQVEGLGPVQRSVVDEDDARRGGSVLAEQVGEHLPQGRSADGRQDDGVVAHATATAASSVTAAPAASWASKSWERRTRWGPRTGRSTGAEPKRWSASRGSSTMGRPAVLSLVLMTTGRPVRPAKAAIVAARRG